MTRLTVVGRDEPAPEAPEPPYIALLRSTLARAEKGEFEGVLIVAQCRGGDPELMADGDDNLALVSVGEELCRWAKLQQLGLA